MQLYRLTFRGLGPFQDEQTIDFRRLAESPLFLLEGPTGSGKSTIIDALVFALYGSVAGSDADDDRLVSQYLPEGVEPFVDLVFSTTAGTFRVRRTPKYERPKARGSGTTTKNATATLWRLGSPDAEGGGEPLATRPTEVGPEIVEAIGLTKSQFIGTVILPQGEFAAFLKAHVRDRQAILQRIFRTDQYEALQRRLRDDRRHAEREIAAAHEAVRHAAGRFALAAGFDAGWEPPADADERVVATDGILVELDARAAECHAARIAREAEEKAARHTLAEFVEKARRRDRKAQALTRKATLDGDRPAQSERVARLEAHDRAARVKGALDGARQADERLDAMLTTESQRRQGVPAEVRAMDSATLAAHAEGLAQQIARLEPLVTLESSLAVRAGEIEGARTRLAELSAQLSDVAAALGALPERRADLQARRDEAQRQAAGIDEAERRVAALAEQLDAAQTLIDARGEQAAAQRRLDLAVDAAKGADQERHRLQQALYAGMAAELATELSDGDPCPVCGSVAHPNPAVPGDDHVSKANVQAAEKRHRVADDEATAAREAKHAVDTKVETLQVRAHGKDVSTLLAEADEARARLDQAQAAARDAETHAAALEAVEQEQRSHEELRTDLVSEQARLTASIDTDQRRLDADREQVEQARGDADSVAERSDATEQQRRGVEALQQAVLASDAARADAARRRQELGDALSAERFTDASDATAALLASPEQKSLEADVQAFRDEDAALAGILAEPELAGVDHEESIDLDAAETAQKGAAKALKDAVEAATLAKKTADETRTCADDVHAAADLHDDLVARSEPVILLGRIVAGERSLLSMTLATYVLRQRFRSVVTAANHHLQRMSDGALTLEATDEAADGRQLAGLGLRVIDLRTGDKARGTGTLSGGETFTRRCRSH